ncbi:hypothetical protein CVT25_001692 [Psilocybe cyanescens]|uniref:Uncharacterized protein n=1 Tax=Psilocybe cyanescens TaxID=93625 RepID=A0A409X5I8_PSICY|nr:hypothetical protein CVT25_001692 [Psilocybe cyanescens]
MVPCEMQEPLGEYAKKQAAIEAAHSERQKERESKNKSRDSSDSDSKGEFPPSIASPVPRPDVDTGIAQPLVSTSGPSTPPPEGSSGGVVASLRRPRTVCHLFSTTSNMTIPKPAEALQVQETNNTASSSTGASTIVSATKKGDQLMKATESLAARNLFAREYLKAHAPTVSQFKTVYDALDKATIKVSILCQFSLTIALPTVQKFEILSRKKKSEASKALKA